MDYKILFLYFSFIFFKVFGEKNFEQVDNNNFLFNIPDLTIDYQNDFHRVRIEAFKSINNDLIIENKEIEKYGQLMWLSIGDPTLILSSDSQKNVTSLVNFRPQGFDISVQTLTNGHKKTFKDVVLRKYNITVKEEQIVTLVPAKFDCYIILFADNNKVLINGRVIQLNRMPFQISFDAPVSSKERIIFEEYFDSKKDNLDIDINCEASSAGQTYRENTLALSGLILNRLGLTDKIFANFTERYVTRHQTSQLSSELYQKLNIMENFQISETKFKDNFMDDFLSMTSTSIDQNINVNEALSLLSRYNFESDIEPNLIYSEMSKIFSINKTGNKEILTLSKTNYDRLINTYGKSKGGSNGESFFGINFGPIAFYVLNKTTIWVNSNISLENQLNDLNSYDGNEVEWQRKGNKIIPISISVSKISKTLFQKDMFFTRIKKEFTESPYKRLFSLKTLNLLNPSDICNDYEKRFQDIEKKFETIVNETSKLINEYSNKIEKELSRIEEKIETIKNETDKVKEINNEFKNQFNLISDILVIYRNATTINGHTGWVSSLTVLQNSNLVSGSFDNTIKIWNLTDRSLIRTLNGHTGAIRALAVLQNGNLVSGSHDKTIKIWNPVDGSLIRTLDGHEDRILSLAVLKNGNLASCSQDKTIKIWDSTNGSLIRNLKNHTDWVSSLLVLENGNLVSCSYDNTIKIWNPIDGFLIRTLNGHTAPVRALTVLQNGNIASGSQDNTIKIWNPTNGSLIRTIEGHTNWIVDLNVLQNGYIVSGSFQKIFIWNPNDGTLTRTLNGHTDWIETLTILQNGDIASGSLDKTIKIWSHHF